MSFIDRNGLTVPGNPVWNNLVSQIVSGMTATQNSPPNVQAFNLLSGAWNQSQRATGYEQNLANQFVQAVFAGLRAAGVPVSQTQAIQNALQARVGQSQSQAQPMVGQPQGPQGYSQVAPPQGMTGPQGAPPFSPTAGGVSPTAGGNFITRNGLTVPGNTQWNALVSQIVSGMTAAQNSPPNVQAYNLLRHAWHTSQRQTGYVQNLANQFIQAVFSGLRSAGVPVSQTQAIQNALQANMNGEGSRRFGTENMGPQQLVDAAANHFQQKATRICKGLLSNNPKCMQELQHLKNLSDSGDWASKQVIANIKTCLIQNGASSAAVNQATMGAEDIANEVSSVIQRANHRDQNAMGMLEQIRANAAKGNPLAVKAYNEAIRQFANGEHDLTDSSFQGDSNPYDSSYSGASFGTTKRSSKSRPSTVSKASSSMIRAASTPAAHYAATTIPASVTPQSGMQSTASKLLASLSSSPSSPSAASVRPTLGQGLYGQNNSGSGGGSSSDSQGDTSGGDSSQDSGGDEQGAFDGEGFGADSTNPNAKQHKHHTPIDKLILAAKNGDKSAKAELDKIMTAEQNGDQRAQGLMHAIRSKTVNTTKGKQARAVSMSHGKPLTTKHVAKMAGDFGAEYGPGAVRYFYQGLQNPNKKIPANTPPKVAHALSQGQVVTMARNLQAARVPGARLSVISPAMGWEMGEASNLHSTMGWEGQYNAAQAGDSNFAQQQIGMGDTTQIAVNQTAFREQIRLRNQYAAQYDSLVAQIATLQHQLPPPATIVYQIRVNVSEFSAEGQYNAAAMGDSTFAQGQMAIGNTREIDVNQDAFRQLIGECEQWKSKIARAQNELASLMVQQSTGVPGAPPQAPITLAVSVQAPDLNSPMIYSPEQY